MAEDLCIAEGVTIAGEELSWSASRSSGPGGQNVNKVATKVTLRFDFEDCPALTNEQKKRLRALAAGRLDADSRIVITAQSERTQARNLSEARDRLRDLIAAALVPPKKRKATRATRGAKERRLAAKRALGEKKRRRASVRTDDG